MNTEGKRRRRWRGWREWRDHGVGTDYQLITSTASHNPQYLPEPQPKSYQILTPPQCPFPRNFPLNTPWVPLSCSDPSTTLCNSPTYIR